MKKTYLSLMVLAALLVPSLSHAETPDVVTLYRKKRDTRAGNLFRADVKKVIRSAEEAEAAGNQQEALDLFHRALHMQQTPALELEYGFALLRAGRYLEAARYLTLAKRETHVLENYTQYPISDIDAGLREVGKHLGMLMVHVNVPDARVMVDNEVIADFPYLSEIYVLPGHHEINGTRAGFWMGKAEVDIKEGESKAVRIGLQPAMDQQILAMPMRMAFSVRESQERVATGPTWPTNMMIAGGIGMGISIGVLIPGLYYAFKTPDPGGWNAVVVSGGVLTGLSLGAILVGNAARPTPNNNITITPTMGSNSGGLKVEGIF